LTLKVEVDSVKESVGVTLDNSRLTGIAIRAGVGRADHRVFSLGGHKQIIPFFFSVEVALLHIDLLDGGTCQIMQWLFRIACLDSFVAGVHLGPSLFKQNDPDLIIG